MLGVSILRVSAGAPGGDPFVILGERSGGRFLTAPIGPTEAISLVMRMEGISTSEPLTHDLFASMFQEAGFIADRVEIAPRGCADYSPDAADSPDSSNSSEGNELGARLFYRAGGSPRVRELRVADALALGLRLGVPFYADEALVRAARSRVILRQSA